VDVHVSVAAAPSLSSLHSTAWLFACLGSGGSGLGLFIAKGIVKLHEGATCGAKSPGRGCGSTFFVTIPVAAEAPAMADSPWASEPSMGGSFDGMAADAAPDEVAVAALNILLVVCVCPPLDNNDRCHGALTGRFLQSVPHSQP